MHFLPSLPIFWLVAEEGSFSAAAKKLDLTQPTVSFHIDHLEKEFGCPLFVRTAKGVTLTVYGKALLEKTHSLQTILDETYSHIRQLVAGDAGHITIGASTIPAEYILPEILAGFLAQYPDVRISLQTGDSSVILRKFQAGSLPLAIIGFQPEVHHYPLWRDDLVLVAHPDFPLPHLIDGQLTVTDIVHYPLILREAASGTRQTLLSVLSRGGVSWENLKIIMETSGNESVKRAVMGQAGISFISRWAVVRELAEGSLRNIPVRNIKIDRTFYALWNPPLWPTCLENLWQALCLTSPFQCSPEAERSASSGT
ncbi:LysR family transcriptional regulator [Acetonema longum]|uniref:LysR family transcriptional regulator n=1 Tax=Acetonema longum DSM 6540 TaxID=1009370 RepID=F7NEW3_9FIRM|nr:LysR family transcriptional regulator [Acetonema longum]EGO65524.1 LysR family transcriptional regulator [Acetonema longum DSM 6540]